MGIRSQNSSEEGMARWQKELIAVGIITLLILLKVAAVSIARWLGLDPREKGYLDLIWLLPLR